MLYKQSASSPKPYSPDNKKVLLFFLCVLHVIKFHRRTLRNENVSKFCESDIYGPFGHQHVAGNNTSLRGRKPLMPINRFRSARQRQPSLCCVCSSAPSGQLLVTRWFTIPICIVSACTGMRRGNNNLLFCQMKMNCVRSGPLDFSASYGSISVEFVEAQKWFGFAEINETINGIRNIVRIRINTPW